MSNKCYHRLCQEFDINYQYNDEFKKYMDKHYPVTIDSIYGTTNFQTNHMKEARSLWKKGRLWFLSLEEVDVWLDSMPFGGYESEKDAILVLKNYRKN